MEQGECAVRGGVCTLVFLAGMLWVTSCCGTVRISAFNLFLEQSQNSKLRMAGSDLSLFIAAALSLGCWCLAPGRRGALGKPIRVVGELDRVAGL